MRKQQQSKPTSVLKLRGFRSSVSGLVAISSLLLSPLLTSIFTPQAVLAEDGGSSTEPTAWDWVHGVSEAQLNKLIKDKGDRIIDIEVEQTAPYKFSAALVKNQGKYASTWWWYYGLNSNQLVQKLQEHKARIIDLEVYQVNGQQRFAVALVPNTGTQAKGWWWYYNVSPDFIASKLKENNARLIDLETSGGSYSAVMISNTGANAKGWWWYYNVSSDFIASKLKENKARLVHIVPNGSNKFSVIMEKSQGEYWWWYFNQTASSVAELVAQNGARIIDIEPYTLSGQKRFAVVMLNNSDATTTRVGQILRNGTDGATGLYLKQVGGPVLAALQENKVFEPASSIKVLHHLHAMRQVQNGVNLQEQITVYQATQGSCPVDQQSFKESLSTALQLMMQKSDNNRTQAIRVRFGQDNINNTAQAIGMKNTSINHRIGCGGGSDGAVAKHNRLTLADAGVLYEGVAKGTLLTTTNRQTFYSLMAGKQFDFSGVWQDIQKMVNEEAPPGMTAAQKQSFLNQVQTSYKAGSYSLSDGQYRSIAGWVQIPFRSSGAVVPRQYVFGIFIDKATNSDKASNTWATARAEVLREQIRAALKTW